MMCSQVTYPPFRHQIAEHLLRNPRDRQTRWGELQAYQVTPGNVAYYALQPMNFGRRTVGYGTRNPTLAPWMPDE